MKKDFIIFLTIIIYAFVFAGCIKQQQEKDSIIWQLRLDGIYCWEDHNWEDHDFGSDKYDLYLRFFESGIVMRDLGSGRSESTRNAFIEFIKFYEEKTQKPDGRYSLNGDQLTFTLEYWYGIIENYNGVITSDGLLMNMSNNKGFERENIEIRFIADGSLSKSDEASIAREKYEKSLRYVNSPEGLRVRNLPDINGERIGLLDYCTEVSVAEEDNNIVNIDGIEGKWVKIRHPMEGWVFDGYLLTEWELNSFIHNIIFGDWRVVNEIDEKMDWDNLTTIYFRENGVFNYHERSTGFKLSAEWEPFKGRIVLFTKEVESEDDLFYNNYNIKNIKYISENRATIYNGIRDTFETIERLNW